MAWILRALLLTISLLGGTGCRFIDAQPPGKSPLLPLSSSPETISLEIYSAPIPLGDPQLAELWREVDEQPLPAELRRRLSENGMRAGVVGPHMPTALAQMLKITDQAISREERSLVALDSEPTPLLRVLQPRPGKRHEQVVSPSYDEVSLLRSKHGEIEGRTYQKAECRLEFRVYPEIDTRARLELTPELHHGDFRKQITGSEGVFVWKQVRSTEVFDDLKLSATLGTGQMLVLTCHSDRPGSVGHYFFTRPGEDKPTQMVWVFRLAQAGADRSFYAGPKEENEVASDLAE